MKFLYSDILPLATEEGQDTIIDAFNEQVLLLDRIDIAVGLEYLVMGVMINEEKICIYWIDICVVDLFDWMQFKG